jgi:hypothetical protein
VSASHSQPKLDLASNGLFVVATLSYSSSSCFAFFVLPCLTMFYLATHPGAFSSFPSFRYSSACLPDTLKPLVHFVGT